MVIMTKAELKYKWAEKIDLLDKFKDMGRDMRTDIPGSKQRWILELLYALVYVNVYFISM